MKELNSLQNIIFRLGALLFIAGLVIRLLYTIWSPATLCGTLLYTIGIVGFASMQVLAEYEGRDITLIRLRRQQVLSDLLFVFSALAMLMQEFNFGPSWAHRNLWVLLLAIGCVLQCYTAYRIPSVVEKLKRNGALSLLLITSFAFTSCATQFNVDGSTSVNELEGSTLYLKNITDDDELVTIDSCQVQHGRIHFSGRLDSIEMVNIFAGDESMMAMVLEPGNITLTIGEDQQNVTGSPLNDTLYAFIHAKVKIDDALQALPSKQSKLIMDGVDEETRNNIIGAELNQLTAENDKLVSGFIIRNSDNVLGTGIFRIITSQSSIPYPMLTPQIEEIMFRAKPYFKNSPYVKKYIEAAKQNQERMILGN